MPALTSSDRLTWIRKLKLRMNANVQAVIIASSIYPALSSGVYRAAAYSVQIGSAMDRSIRIALILFTIV